jgi:hypothetical protein
MSDERLVRLAQELEWLGCEAGFYSKQISDTGAEAFREKQREIVATVEKMERELKSAVRFNLTSLVGIDYPIEWAFDSITNLLAALQSIKQCSAQTADELPSAVRRFSRMINDYVHASLPLSA